MLFLTVFSVFNFCFCCFFLNKFIVENSFGCSVKLFIASIVRILSTLFFSHSTQSQFLCQFCYVFKNHTSNCDSVCVCMRKNVLFCAFHQLFDLILFAKMIKGSFEKSSLCSPVCLLCWSSDIESFLLHHCGSERTTSKQTTKKKRITNKLEFIGCFKARGSQKFFQ